MPEVAVMSAVFGAYGKMPGLGDFFRLGLPRDFVDPWDTWLQESLLAVRQALGDAWHDAYMSAPIWRFTLSPGLAGPRAVVGVLMASVDRVGRQFPLTLGASVADSASAVSDHYAAHAAFQELEGHALDALDDGMTRDRLEATLAGVTFSPPARGARVTLAPGSVAATHATQFGPVPEMAAALLSERLRRPSVWSANAPGGMRLLACDGLPAAHQVRGLFDMNAPMWAGGGHP